MCGQEFSLARLPPGRLKLLAYGPRVGPYACMTGKHGPDAGKPEIHGVSSALQLMEIAVIPVFLADQFIMGSLFDKVDMLKKNEFQKPPIQSHFLFFRFLYHQNIPVVYLSVFSPKS